MDNRILTAIIRNDLNEVKRMINEGYDRTPMIGSINLLNFAVRYKRDSIVDYLLNIGEDINMSLRYFAFVGEIPHMKYLIQKGANDFINSLWCAAYGNRNDVIVFLMEKNINVNSIGDSGETAIGIAIINNNLDIVKLLKETYGANFDIPDIAGIKISDIKQYIDPEMRRYLGI